MTSGWYAYGVGSPKKALLIIGSPLVNISLKLSVNHRKCSTSPKKPMNC